MSCGRNKGGEGSQNPSLESPVPTNSLLLADISEKPSALTPTPSVSLRRGGSQPDWLEKIVPDPTQLGFNEKMPLQTTLFLQGAAAEYLYQGLTAIIPRKIKSKKKQEVFRKEGWNIDCSKTVTRARFDQTIDYRCSISLQMESRSKKYHEFVKKNVKPDYQQTVLQNMHLYFAQGTLAQILYDKMEGNGDEDALISLARMNRDNPFDPNSLKPIIEHQQARKIQSIKTQDYLACIKILPYTGNQAFYTCLVQVHNTEIGDLFFL